MISYKYNIYKSKNTKHLDKMLRECAFVWNHALNLQKRYYRRFGKYISLNRLQKHFAKRIKRILLHSQTVQEILGRLDNSYKRFFKKLCKRPPKFKKAEKFNSFVFKQGGFALNGNVFTINKINKRFKFSYSRPYDGNVKQVRVLRETCNRYSIVIVTDSKSNKTYEKSRNGASVGIDFGLKTYMTLSDGKSIQSPLFFNRYQKKIKKCNRNLSRSEKGSNNRKRRLFELHQTNWRVRVIPTVVKPGSRTLVSKNPNHFSGGSMSTYRIAHKFQYAFSTSLPYELPPYVFRYFLRNNTRL